MNGAKIIDNKNMKYINTRYNIGKAKYVVTYYDDERKPTHKDGSSFHDIRIFSNKKKMGEFIKTLK